MEHEEIRDLLSDYHDDRLEAARRALVAAHLTGCANCRAELNCYAEGEAILRAATRRPAPLQTEALVAAVRRRVESAPEIAWLGSLLASPRWAVPAFAVAFAALLATVRTPAEQHDPSEALLIAQDGGRIYGVITGTSLLESSTGLYSEAK